MVARNYLVSLLSPATWASVTENRPPSGENQEAPQDAEMEEEVLMQGEKRAERVKETIRMLDAIIKGEERMKDDTIDRFLKGPKRWGMHDMTPVPRDFVYADCWSRSCSVSLQYHLRR